MHKLFTILILYGILSTVSGRVFLSPACAAENSAAGLHVTPHQTVSGTVVTYLGKEPMVGVNVLVKGTLRGTVTDARGAFAIEASLSDTLLFSFIGYETLEEPLNGRQVLHIELIEDISVLTEITVYSTGYQDIPQESATGSFTRISQELVNRSTGTDVITRLEGITGSLHFDRRNMGAGGAYGDDYRSLRIRGVSSINTGNDPLIVVDHFPYDGDIHNINPNDIESITVLKDAAAASLWGARAGNGVIVITTRKGRYNQPLKLNVTSNITIGEKPDLYYNPKYLSSPDFISAEKEMFNSGYYTSKEKSNSKPVLSPVVEILIKQRDGQLSQAEASAQMAALEKLDAREQAEEYLYRQAVRQQYALSAQGGSDNLLYYLSGGYDQNKSNVAGNRFERFTLNASNTFKPIEPLELSAEVAFTQNNSENNGIGWGTATRFPYSQLADEAGNPLAVPWLYRPSYVEQAESQGLLDWQYRPLQEVALSDNTSRNSEIRLNTGVHYRFLQDFNLSLKYQYQSVKGEGRNLRSEDSYYVRDLVNRFTQADGSLVFPLGQVLSESHSQFLSHSARAQLNYGKSFGTRHQLAALAGAEVRQVHQTGSSFTLYGYDDEVLTWQSQLDYLTRYPVRPSGTARITPPSSSLSDLLDRYYSYYGNASYTYAGRYMLSGSMRWDASNLFGVKTNQKIVPLWSAGLGWNMHEEDFYHLSWLPLLKLRLTYGWNGNANNQVTAYPTAYYYSDYLTGYRAADVRNAGNPQLRWEKIATWNFGIDLATKNSRLSGSIDLYHKDAQDLLGAVPVDPTSGFIPDGILKKNIANYASIRTRGVDLELTTVNIASALKWQTTFLVSHQSNKVTEYEDATITATELRAAVGLNSSTLPHQGKSIDGLYSLPWIGLDEAGDPQVMLEGQLSKDYNTYLQELSFDDLVYHGVSVPRFFGAFRNTFSWKGFSLSANITWKAGYYFRRSSINYSLLFSNWEAHKDYAARWQVPGDEAVTSVPAMPQAVNSNRDLVYTGSSLLVEKGDHIRLQDIRLGYTLSNNRRLPFTRLEVFGYASNLGILWRANRKGLDPDIPNAVYPQVRTFSFGVNANF